MSLGCGSPARETRYKPEHVPEFLQEDWYQRHFVHIGGINPLHVRRMAAIYLCQLAAGGSMGKAAAHLGIPVSRVSRSVRALDRWARSNSQPAQFETAVHDLADELDSAPHLVNYQRRRQALSNWCIDPSTWQLILTQLPPRTAQRMGDQERQEASILTWARITQGSRSAAPRPIRDNLPPDIRDAWLRRATTVLARFRSGPPGQHNAELRHMLDEYGDALAERMDRGEFP